MKKYLLIALILAVSIACGSTPTPKEIPALPPAATSTVSPPTATIVPTEYSFSGAGNQATSTFQLYAGLVRFENTYQGDSNFIAKLLDEHGEQVAVVANSIGPGDTSKAVQVESSGPYLLNVTASGEWTIKLTQ